MDYNQLVPGKISLNQYVHQLEQNGASFHVHYWGAMPNHYDTLLHKHSFYEVCYVLDGTGHYIENECTYPLQKNTLFFSRPGVQHQIKSETGLYILYVAFELIESKSSEKWISLMEEVKRGTDIVLQVKDDDPPALLWKTLMIQAVQPGQTFFREILTHLASSLILALLQTVVTYSHHVDQNECIEKSSALLTQVKLHIKDNLSQSLRLTDVAGHFHISGRHLSRLFVSELGVSYSEYVRNTRIQKAAALLKTTEFTIKHIAEEIGFTVHYFTRVFTSEMGSSPGLFRALYKNSKMTVFQKSRR
ncbi:AraC family transcriptional regulator [Bacillus atrophaeus]